MAQQESRVEERKKPAGDRPGGDRKKPSDRRARQRQGEGESQNGGEPQKDHGSLSTNLVGEREPADLPGAGRLLGNVVSTENTPSFFALEFRLEAGMVTRPGKFVAIEATTADGRASMVLARVNDIHEVNPHEDPLSATLKRVIPFGTKYAPEGHSTVIYRLASAEPLEEAVVDHGEIVEIRSVETLPKAGNCVFEASPELTVKALGLQPDPDEGIHVGAAYGDSETPIVLGKGIIQRHVFIAGGIGSGKSYTRGVLAEELQAMGVPQINIDVNGELIEATEELHGLNLVPGKGGFTLPVSALSAADVVEAVPSINPGTNMETLLRFTHEHLQKEILNGKRSFFTVNDLVGHIDLCANMLEMTTGSGDNRKLDVRTVEPTKLRTQSLNRLPFLGVPFVWKEKIQPGAVINIDCRGLLLSELRLITASIARDLQNLARNKEIPFVALSIDEFHLVAPAGDETVTTQVLREIARIGRHHKLGLILTTQSPSDVDRSILKRLLTRFLHAIEPDQLDSLRGVFSDASADLIRSLPKLPQGACILTGAFETVRHATVIKIRERETTHGGKTPDIWSDLARAGWTKKRYSFKRNGR